MCDLFKLNYPNHSDMLIGLEGKKELLIRLEDYIDNSLYMSPGLLEAIDKSETFTELLSAVCDMMKSNVNSMSNEVTEYIEVLFIIDTFWQDQFM